MRFLSATRKCLPGREVRMSEAAEIIAFILAAAFGAIVAGIGFDMACVGLSDPQNSDAASRHFVKGCAVLLFGIVVMLGAVIALALRIGGA